MNPTGLEGRQGLPPPDGSGYDPTCGKCQRDEKHGKHPQRDGSAHRLYSNPTRNIVQWSFAAIVNGIYPFEFCADCNTAIDIIGHLREHLRQMASQSPGDPWEIYIWPR